MTLKAHAGEFLGADSVIASCETLMLTEIQHGIRASEDRSVMHFLERNKIQLNICPTSNVRLSRVQSLKTHPMRILADAGIRITLNSDDIMIFNQTVSEEYLNVFKSGLFSSTELDAIRVFGLGK